MKYVQQGAVQVFLNHFEEKATRPTTKRDTDMMVFRLTLQSVMVNSNM